MISTTLVCARCASLMEECNRRARRYSLALGALDAARTSEARLRELRAAAEGTKVGLKLAETEYLRHRETHRSELIELHKSAPATASTAR